MEKQKEGGLEKNSLLFGDFHRRNATTFISMVAGLVMNGLALAFTFFSLTLFLSSTYFHPLCGFVFFVLRAATIVKVANLGAIKRGFLEHRIDLVVDKTSPACGCIAGRDLWRILLQVLLEVRGAFAADLVSIGKLREREGRG